MAVRVFDHLVDAIAIIKDLVGRPALKAIARSNGRWPDLKQAIRVWAGDDPVLSQWIGGLVAEERRTLDRRFGRLSGVGRE